MKLKLQFICFLIALCAINVFNAFGQTNDRVFYTLDFTKKNTSINSYTATWNYPSDGINWTIYAASNYMGKWDYVRTGGKGTTTSKNISYYQSLSSILGRVSSVTITCIKDYKSSFYMDNIYLYVSSNGKFEDDDIIDKVSYNTFSNTAITFKPTNGKVWNNAYYKVEFVWHFLKKVSGYDGLKVKSVQFLKSKDDIYYKIGDTGYSTFYYSDRAFLVPKGVEAYTYKIVDGKLEKSKTYVNGYTIPKDDAVVLKAEPGSYWFDKFNTSKVKDENNMLKGTDNAELTEGGDIYYKLSLNSKREDGSVGFYWGAQDGGAFTNGAHKAYLALDSQQAEAVKEFRLEVEVTKIDGVHGDNQEDVIGNGKKQAYNISGQRVDDNYKGLVIINGKKVIRR